MGYCVTYNFSDATIAREHFPAAIEAINNLFTPEVLRKNLTSWSKDHYSWLEPGLRSHTNLLVAIEEWGFHCTFSGQGAAAEILTIHSYTLSKMGDENVLFKAIAPYLNSNCAIEAIGEDGEQWRYIVRDGAIVEQKAVITWRDADGVFEGES